jgi:hypothetical protein
MFVVKSVMNSGIFVVFFVIEHFWAINLSSKEVRYMKSIFEQIGGTYTKQGDYCLPNIYLPPEEERPIGVWGQRRLRHLKQHHKVLYYNLLTSGKLHSHLADVEEEAQSLFSRLVKEFAEKEGVTEQLKATDPMAWVQRMNNIRERVTEMVNAEVVFE